MKKGEHLLSWKCKCGRVNKTTLQKLDWNFDNDRCGDVDVVMFFLNCESCNEETVLYTKGYNEV